MFKNLLKDFYYKYFTTDTYLIKKRFKKRLGRKVNLKYPQKYNDKLQWLKLYWRDPLATKCADKYEVRNIIKRKIGKEYLNEVLAVYTSVDDIDINELPDAFALKCTHGSGFNIICKDKNKLDWKKAKRQLKRWMKTNYYLQNREWVYKDIKPRIICEKFLDIENEKDFKDYRVFCFDGEPYMIAIDFDINNKKDARRNIYDLNWNLRHETITYPNEISEEIERPKQLDEMLEISKILSKGFPHVRVDFYIIDNKLFFSEMTFFHQSGMGVFSSEEFELELGQQIKLPKNLHKN